MFHHLTTADVVLSVATFHLIRANGAQQQQQQQSVVELTEYTPRILAVCSIFYFYKTLNALMLRMSTPNSALIMT